MIVGYLAMSLDGFIAEADGSVGFLDPYSGEDHGYETFYSGIDALIMGRATYDQVIGFGVDWPYAGKPCHVVTSGDLPSPPVGVQRWRHSLKDYAVDMASKTAWVVGGAKLQAAFLTQGLLDRLDVFVIPVLLGDGVPLFPHHGAPLPLTLAANETLAGGVVRLTYRADPV